MLSVIIIAKNEEINIVRAIKSVSFADEILLIDDNSTDHTALKAMQAGATILTHTLNNNFSAQRNFALEKARGEWILFIDADEVVGEELKKEILLVVQDTAETDFFAYYIPRHDWFWGRKIRFGEVYGAAHQGIIRLVKKNSGLWEGEVHETFKLDKKTGRLKNHLDHYPHQTISEFLSDINSYSTIRAEECEKRGIKTSIVAIVLIPFFKFIYTYFLKVGFLDGPAGFVYSFMMSFHSFLVRTKLYVKNIGSKA